MIEFISTLGRFALTLTGISAASFAVLAAADRRREAVTFRLAAAQHRQSEAVHLRPGASSRAQLEMPSWGASPSRYLLRLAPSKAAFVYLHPSVREMNGDENFHKYLSGGGTLSRIPGGRLVPRDLTDRFYRLGQRGYRELREGSPTSGASHAVARPHLVPALLS